MKITKFAFSLIIFSVFTLHCDEAPESKKSHSFCDEEYDMRYKSDEIFTAKEKLLYGGFLVALKALEEHKVNLTERLYIDYFYMALKYHLDDLGIRYSACAADKILERCWEKADDKSLSWGVSNMSECTSCIKHYIKHYKENPISYEENDHYDAAIHHRPPDDGITIDPQYNPNQAQS